MTRAKVRMAACLSLDFRVSTGSNLPPLSEGLGGWTSQEDKTEFRAMVDQADILMAGAKTALLMPAFGKPMAVITSAPRHARASWTLKPTYEQISSFLSMHHGSTVLLCGGPRTYTLLLGMDFVDEIVLTIEPKMLGAGPLMCEHPSGFWVNYELVYCREINSKGTVQLMYRRGYNGQR